MEFLKREGLYSPQMKDMRVDDPVATDLIGALLTVRLPFIHDLSDHFIAINFDFNFVHSKDHRIRFHHDAVRTIRWCDRPIDKTRFCCR